MRYVFLFIFIFFSSIVEAQAPQCASFDILDQDYDGIPASLDCDDNDFNIVTGTPRFSGGQYQRCDAQGNWVTVTGKQHWVDCDAPVNGNGDSPSTPFNTACCIDQYNATIGAAECPGQTNLGGTHQPGDTVWIKGQCPKACTYDFSNGTALKNSLTLRNENGTSGNNINILGDPTGTQNFDDFLYISNSQYVTVQGIKRSNVDYLPSLRVRSSEFVNVYNNHYENNTHDNSAGSNPADIDIRDSESIEVKWNKSFELAPSIGYTGLTANYASIVSFNTGKLTVNRNYITRNSTTSCGNEQCSAIKIKHSDHLQANAQGGKLSDIGGTEIAYNVIEGGVSGIEFSEKNMVVHHNYIKGQTDHGLASTDVGGPTYGHNLSVYNNTIVGPGRCIKWDLHKMYSVDGFNSQNINNNQVGGIYGPISFKNNVCIDTSTNSEPVRFSKQASNFHWDEYQANWKSQTNFNNNCYQSPNDTTPRFDFMSGNGDSNQPGQLNGGICTFADWQGTSNPLCPNAMDVNSQFANANLDSCGCTSKVGTDDTCLTDLQAGYCFAGDDTATVSITATDPNAAENNNGTPDNGQFTITLSNPVSTPVTVTCSATGTATVGLDYVTNGSSFTIPAGQTTANISIFTLEDTLDEPNETVIKTIATSNANVTVDSNNDTATAIIADDDDPVDPADPNGWLDRFFEFNIKRRYCKGIGYLCD